MLTRIGLIVAIVAALAIGALNFTKIREEITTLQTNLATETAGRQLAETELAGTNSILRKTSAELKTTKETLATTTSERDKAVAEAEAKTKEADLLTKNLKDVTAARDAAQVELAQFHATGLTPKQILAANGRIRDLESTVAGTEAENVVLGRKIKKLQNQLATYITPNYVVPLPAGLKGKVLASDPKWNFVILNVGEEQGVLEQGELLVNRDGRLVAKVKVQTVQKDRSIANVMPGWQLGEVMEGDQVIPAHPAS
jgi:hypothetical protein